MANLNESVLKKVCRTCLTPSTDMESLYELSADFDVSFADMLMAYMPLKFHEQDDLPTQICCNCIGELNRFNTFKWRCLESDAMLRNSSDTNTNTKPPNIYRIDVNSSKFNPNSSYVDYSNKTTIKTEIKHEILDDSAQLETNDAAQFTNSDTGHEIEVDIVKNEIFDYSSDDSDSNSVTSLKKVKKPEPITGNLYICTICNSVFKQNSLLVAHTRTHEAKSHKCAFCHMLFDRKAHLSRHTRMHTGEKPYACPDCGDTFNNKSNLTVHRRTHTKEKPYACDVCGIAYSQSNSLTVHMQTHLDAKLFVCPVCGKAFNRNANLTRHMLIHDGEKPYTCAQCGESFHKERFLIVHTRTHGDEVSYPCSVCGKLFKRKGHMTRHLKLHK